MKAAIGTVVEALETEKNNCLPGLASQNKCKRKHSFRIMTSERSGSLRHTERERVI